MVKWNEWTTFLSVLVRCTGTHSIRTTNGSHNIATYSMFSNLENREKVFSCQIQFDYDSKKTFNKQTIEIDSRNHTLSVVYHNWMIFSVQRISILYYSSSISSFMQLTYRCDIFHKNSSFISLIRFINIENGWIFAICWFRTFFDGKRDMKSDSVNYSVDLSG